MRSIKATLSYQQVTYVDLCSYIDYFSGKSIEL
jgi:hypothetical protein